VDNEQNIIVEVRTVHGVAVLKLPLGVIVARYMDDHHIVSPERWDIYANNVRQAPPIPSSIMGG